MYLKCAPSRYKCRGDCGQPFSSASGLRSHEDQHRGEYRYRCQYCHQGFPSTTNLRRHLTKHTGVQAFVCLHCGNAFSSLGDLKRHSKSCQQRSVKQTLRELSYISFTIGSSLFGPLATYINTIVHWMLSLFSLGRCSINSNQFETSVQVQLLFVLHQYGLRFPS